MSNVMQVSDGVLKEIMRLGSGNIPQRGSIITVHCTGFLANPLIKFWRYILITFFCLKYVKIIFFNLIYVLECWFFSLHFWSQFINKCVWYLRIIRARLDTQRQQCRLSSIFFPLRNNYILCSVFLIVTCILTYFLSTLFCILFFE